MTTDTQNILTAFFETANKGVGRVCARCKQDGKWRTITWDELSRFVCALASRLIERRLETGDRAVICSKSSLYWTIADLAILAAGGVTVPIYPSLTADRFAKIVRDSTPMLIFAGDDAIARRFLEGGIMDVPIILLEDKDGKDEFGQMLLPIDPSEGGEIKSRVLGIAPSQIATIVYTSGTTGEQKGAVLTHGNLFHEVRGAQDVLEFKTCDVGLACLPPAHVLGRLMQFYCLVQGCEIAYAEGIDKLAENYLELKPTFLCGVPRMLEKVHELVFAKTNNSPQFMQAIFKWSLSTGLERSNVLEKGLDVGFGLRVRYAVADLLVFRKIRGSLGGRLECFISGGAPLAEDIAKFFHAAGILILEGYGLTETFAAATVNRMDDYRFGTVGKPLPGVRMKIAEDGEISFAGPTVFSGYWNSPKETKAAFDAHGYFRTGDLGEFTRDGFLRITGRKKEIIVTAGGKNIAPQMIETLMLKSPYISHFMVYGDGRKFLTALVTVNEAAALEYLKKFGLKDAVGEAIGRHPAIRELIARHVGGENKKLASFETVKKFTILDGDFSIEAGELTPTLKVRREFVAKKYADVLEGLYK